MTLAQNLKFHSKKAFHISFLENLAKFMTNQPTHFNLGRKIMILLSLLLLSMPISAQTDLGTLTGSFQSDTQYYTKDSIIGAQAVAEKIRNNTYLNLLYTRGAISAGARYESYQKPLLGFDERYAGSGIAFRYASWNGEDLQVTVGNFYEQFGNGFSLRSYEERQLGIDNALDGIRIKATPTTGINLTGLIGRQRNFWDIGAGIVRGGDADFDINELMMNESPLKLKIGASIVSRYQDTTNPVYYLSANVGVSAVRFSANYNDWSLSGEYAHKSADPSSFNEFLYADGTAYFAQFGYSTKGFGLNLTGKRIDNMNFRSDRYQTGNSLNINYLPAITKQHTYLLAAIYPFATQPNGEVGFQADILYQLPKGTDLGGEYGTNLAFNCSQVKNLDKTTVDKYTYSTEFPGTGNILYYEDANLEISRKLSSQLKATLTMIYLVYNKDVIEGTAGHGTIISRIAVGEFQYKFTPTHALRMEFQHLWTAQDNKNWLAVLGEYSVAPSWYFSAFDEYNYGNADETQRIHYYSGGITFAKDLSRFALSWGRQRAGILCVGGVCRQVPAASGLLLSISSSF